jgi:hypothetical protein
VAREAQRARLNATPFEFSHAATLVVAEVRLSLPSLLTRVTKVTKLLQRAKDTLSPTSKPRPG